MSERYQRQLQLQDFGASAQNKLLDSKVLVVGAGGLGIPVLQYLNAMGVGTLGIVDGDTISLTNLHRQVLYDAAEVGQKKVSVAVEKLRKQNPDTNWIVYSEFLTVANALSIIEDFDLVVDASDNFPTRYLVNDACVILKKPFVYGALHGFEGQVSVFNHAGGPTYRCLFPKMPKPGEVPDCNTNGVLGVLPGIIGTFQALEAVKVITGVGEALVGRLLLFDGMTQQSRTITFRGKEENKNIKQLQETYQLDCGLGIRSIFANQLEALLENGNLQLLDVRTEAEFRSFHVPGSLHIPLDALVDRMHELDFDRTIYCICQSGVRSLNALELLHEKRPEADLVQVEGGIDQLHVS